jgi:hypothetical protein
MSLLQFIVLFIAGLVMITLGGMCAAFGADAVTQWVGTAAMLLGMFYALNSVVKVGIIR